MCVSVQVCSVCLLLAPRARGHRARGHRARQKARGACLLLYFVRSIPLWLEKYLLEYCEWDSFLLGLTWLLINTWLGAETGLKFPLQKYLAVICLVYTSHTFGPDVWNEQMDAIHFAFLKVEFGTLCTISRERLSGGAEAAESCLEPREHPVLSAQHSNPGEFSPCHCVTGWISVNERDCREGQLLWLKVWKELPIRKD